MSGETIAASNGGCVFCDSAIADPGLENDSPVVRAFVLGCAIKLRNVGVTLCVDHHRQVERQMVRLGMLRKSDVEPYSSEKGAPS